jgi:3-hydroxyacyl-CoA dehydrogenase
MFWGELVGLDTILAKMQDFQAKFGDDFKPSALLERLAAERKGFKDA